MKRRLSSGDIRQLHQLGGMRDKGILTADEFAHQKGILLDQDVRGANDGLEVRKRRKTPWLAGAFMAVLILTIAIVGISSGGPNARERGDPASTGQR